jgi:hypothetical protein
VGDSDEERGAWEEEEGEGGSASGRDWCAAVSPCWLAVLSFSVTGWLVGWLVWLVHSALCWCWLALFQFQHGQHLSSLPFHAPTMHPGKQFSAALLMISGANGHNYTGYIFTS